MNIQLKITLLLIAIFNLLSCSTTRISDNTMNVNPYQKGDVLVFKSSLGETDTLFVSAIARFESSGDPLALFPKKAIENITVTAKHRDPIFPRYLETSILSINNTYIDFNFKTKKARFYSGNFYDLNEFQKSARTSLSIAGKTYNDVIIVKSPNTEYRKRDNFIETIYWSVSNGYVKYDLANGTTWELERNTAGNTR